MEVEKRKLTVKQIQCLTGSLNFLNKAIVPGRLFMRRMYAKVPTATDKDTKLKHYHHMTLDGEFKADCRMWLLFFNNTNSLTLTRPFIDLDAMVESTDIGMYSDTSRGETKGYGCILKQKYSWAQWEPGCIKNCNPSIEYLELFGLVAGLLTWRHEPILNNTRVQIYCDNTSVRDMVNATTSGCKNCMFLLRVLVLEGLLHNRRVKVVHVKSSKNSKSDALSQLQFRHFFKLSPKSVGLDPAPVPKEIWPPSKYWIW